MFHSALETLHAGTQVQRTLAGMLQDTFDNIVAQYRHRAFRLALSILNDHALAEDALQESLLRIWKGLPGFRQDSELSTWIYSIVRNTSLNVLQAARSRPVLRNENPSRELAVAPSRASVDVEALVARLRPQYQQVVRLYYMQEKSYEETAAMLAIPVGTVKTILHRAKLEMAATLKRSNSPQRAVIVGEK